MRLRITYHDHNEHFARHLPRAGRVAARLSATDGVDDWFLLKLDVGDRTPTSVFILIVSEASVPRRSPISVQDYDHVAWGMCHGEPWWRFRL